MKEKAQKMIEDQQQEIIIFDRIIQSDIPPGNSDFGQKANGMMTPMSDIKMERGSLDALFASMMITHHQDAIKMAQEYLKIGSNEKLKKVAQSCIPAKRGAGITGMESIAIGVSPAYRFLKYISYEN